MSDSDEFVIHTDGGARGNPGPAGYAFTIERPGEDDVEDKGYLGTATNNVAEYTALVRALEKARELGGRKLLVKSDSELMVQQMNGAYKVKNAGLLPLYQQARDLVRAFERVTIRHIRREQNSRADALCNEAMDNPRDHTWPTAAPAVKPPPVAKPAPIAKKEPADPRAAGLAYLAECASHWSRGSAQDPDPQKVIDKLWTIFKGNS